MIIEYPTYQQETNMAITLYSPNMSKFLLSVGDANNPNLLFTDRSGQMKGEKTYYVRMPISPEVSFIELQSDDGSITIEEIKLLDLPTNYSNDLFNEPFVQSFIKFAEEFSIDVNNLEPNAVYSSDDDMYNITLQNKLYEDGEVANTPARISKNDGMIEVAKFDFERYTLPMRMAILLHEFAHFYLNTNMTDEKEADDLSLQLYLGMGYPRIDAYNVYLDVFKNAPSDLNRERYMQLKDIINKNYIEYA